MSQDEIEPLSSPPESCPFAQQLCMPQFGIIHLMILTAVVAVLLKINLAMSFNDVVDASSMQSWLSWSRQFFQTIYAVLFATELVGAGLLVRARCFAMLGRLQPGHWIILISALIGILGRLSWPLYLFFSTDSSAGFWITIVNFGAIYLLRGVLYCFAAARLRDAKRWRFLFVTNAAGDFIMAAALVLGILAGVGSGTASPSFGLMVVWNYVWPTWSVVLLLMLPLVTVMDLPRRSTRDWLHWLGIALYGLGILLAVFQYVWFQVIARFIGRLL